MTRERSHDFCHDQARPLTTPEDEKLVEQENRKRKAAAKACQSLDTRVSKVPRQEPSDADNDSAVCDDSPAETTTSDLSQLTTVLQRDIEGKSYLFSQCLPVLIPLLCSEI